jgi:WD40 repeat protein
MPNESPVRRIQNLFGHGASVPCIAFSPDSKWLASASWDNFVRVWDVKTGKVFKKFADHTKGVNCVAFSPDGKLLASGSSDCSIKIWNWDTGLLLSTIQGRQHSHNDGVTAIAFSPKGKWLAAALLAGKAKVWRVEQDTARLVEPRTLNLLERGFLGSYSSMITSLAFTRNDRTLALASRDHTVRLWDVDTGRYVNMLDGHSADVTAVNFSPDGKWLASASRDGTVGLCTGVSEHARRKLAVCPRGVETVFVLEERSMPPRPSSDLVMGTAAASKIIKGHTDAVLSVAFAPNSMFFASASLDQTVRLWNVNSGREMVKLGGHGAGVRSVAFSGDGQYLASASYDGSVVLWDVSKVSL